MAIDPVIIAGYLDAAARSPDAQSRGAAYEDLVAYLFAEIPGCIVERNLIGPLRTEQIDVAVGNSRDPEGLPLLPNIFLVECKDWDRPVDSTTLGYFINTLTNRGLELGVLVAANGITGSPSAFTNAYALGVSAAPRGIRVLVITSTEISAWPPKLTLWKWSLVGSFGPLPQEALDFLTLSRNIG